MNTTGSRYRGEYAVEAVDVSKHYGEKAVLDRVSLTAATGQVLGILGHNGAGKSTLLRIITTLTRPDPGSTVRIAGVDALADGRRARTLFGSAGQSSTLDPLLTGSQNLCLIAGLRGMRRSQARAAAANALHAFDLADDGDRPVSTYAGGMARGLDLASALIDTPPILFLDEPTTGIDPQARRTIWDRIAAVAAAGTCVVLTTQYLEEAEQLAERILILRAGRIVADGTPAELKQGVATERLDLTFDSAAACTLARQRLAREFDVSDMDESSLSVAVPRGNTDARAALQVVASLDAPLLEARRRTASLDDVFFSTFTHSTQRGNA